MYALLSALGLAHCVPEGATLSQVHREPSQPEVVNEPCRGGISCEQLLQRVGLHDGSRVCLDTPDFEESCTGMSVCGVIFTGFSATGQTDHAVDARLGAAMHAYCPECKGAHATDLLNARLRACFIIRGYETRHGKVREMGWRGTPHPSDCRADISFDDARLRTSFAGEMKSIQLSQLDLIQTREDWQRIPNVENPLGTGWTYVGGF